MKTERKKQILKLGYHELSYKMG